MAVRGVGIADTDGIQITNNSVVGFASGGTLDSSNVVQINFDDSIFTNANGGDGKQRLMAALQFMMTRIATTTVWPITSAS